LREVRREAAFLPTRRASGSAWEATPVPAASTPNLPLIAQFDLPRGAARSTSSAQAAVQPGPRQGSAKIAAHDRQESIRTTSIVAAVAREV
jgi:hypothetical protein